MQELADEMQELEEEEEVEEEQLYYSKTSKREELVVEISSGEIREKNKNGKVWSEEDEISLLSGYYEYHIELGRKDKYYCDGGAGTTGFYEFIKPRLRPCCCVKQSQVSDKIYRLKKKFMDHDHDHDASSSKVLDPHLQKLFELSTKIWSTTTTEEEKEEEIFNNNVPSSEEVLGVKNFDFSNHFLSQEFLDFLYHEGVDVHLLDSQTLTNLKRKYGQVELSRTIFEYKQAKLNIKLQDLKYHHYNTAFHNFF